MLHDFHDITFPLDISAGARSHVVRRTDVIALGSGYERRNARWANGRRRYDVGLGLRNLDAVHALIIFFEERRGRLHGFRFRDRADCQSCPPLQQVTPLDQVIGTGNGTQTSFSLVKTYGAAHAPYRRAITKPVAGTVRVALDGVEIGSGFTCNALSGLVTFAAAPASGSVITAGFVFDVPVRFEADELAIDFASFNAGSAPQVGLVEVG